MLLEMLLARGGQLDSDELEAVNSQLCCDRRYAIGRERVVPSSLEARDDLADESPLSTLSIMDSLRLDCIRLVGITDLDTVWLDSDEAVFEFRTCGPQTSSCPPCHSRLL